MKKALIITAVILAAAAGGIYYAWWSSAIKQPQGFSHAQHVAQNIDCAVCHGSAGEYTPLNEKCDTCHQGMNLPADVHWVKVYRTAPDIIFSHVSHRSVECSECHEAMTSARKVVHEWRYPMDFCMKCHSQRGAQNTCGTCHRNR